MVYDICDTTFKGNVDLGATPDHFGLRIPDNSRVQQPSSLLEIMNLALCPLKIANKRNISYFSIFRC